MMVPAPSGKLKMIRVTTNAFDRPAHRREVERLANRVRDRLAELGEELFAEAAAEDGSYPLAVFERGAMRDIDEPWRDQVLRALEDRGEVKIAQRACRSRIYRGGEAAPPAPPQKDQTAKYLGPLLLHHRALLDAHAEYLAGRDAEDRREARRFALEHGLQAEKTITAALKDEVDLEVIRSFLPVPEEPSASNWLLFYMPWLAPACVAEEILRSKPRKPKRAVFGDDVAGHILSKLAPRAEAGSPMTLNELRQLFYPKKRDRMEAALREMVQDGRVLERGLGGGIVYTLPGF